MDEMECPKCGGLMRKVPTNVKLKLSTGALMRGHGKAMIDTDANAFVCEKCCYVEFYSQPAPFGYDVTP